MYLGGAQLLELTTFYGNTTQWRPNCRKLDHALSGHRSSQQREPLGQLAPFALELRAQRSRLKRRSHE